MPKRWLTIVLLVVFTLAIYIMQQQRVCRASFSKIARGMSITDVERLLRMKKTEINEIYVPKQLGWKSPPSALEQTRYGVGTLRYYVWTEEGRDIFIRSIGEVVSDMYYYEPSL